MVYPTILAGQRITDELLTSMIPPAVMKQATTSRASTTTPAADPELVLPLEASAQYIIDGQLLIGGSSVTPDFLMAVSGPGGSSGTWAATAPAAIAGATPDESPMRHRSFSLGTSGGFGLNGGFNSKLILHARITTAGAGNLTIDWSQVTSNATATDLASGSWIRAQRIS